MDKFNNESTIIINSNKKNLELKFEKDIKKVNRYKIIDNIKGILIFFVVFGHFLIEYSYRKKDSLSYKIVNYIYGFHMPSFIFWSGFLSKSENSRNFKSIIKLILIYIIFNFSHGFILYIYKNLEFSFYYPYNSYWYLLSLIYWRFSIIYFSNQFLSILISFIISFLIGFCIEINSIFSIKRSFAFFPYFLIGYKFSKFNLENIIYKRKNYYFLNFFFFFIFICLSLRYIPFIEINHSMMLNNYKNINNDILIRLILFIFSFFMIIFSILLVPNTNIFIITTIGKNSLCIYLFHRIITIYINYQFFDKYKYDTYIILYSLIFSIIILLIFGSNLFTKIFYHFINNIYQNLYEMNLKGKLISLIFSIFFILILLIQTKILIIEKNKKEVEMIQKADLAIKLINNYDFENAIRISYVGDLILLKDQVISAKNESNGIYDFDEIFKYASDHLKKSDLSIGVYEGPSAGNKTSYSTSNYDDGINLYLNFPDEFAHSVKKAGIDLVTTANNHLLDKGIKGALRTIDILKKNNIIHTGSYKKKTNNLLIMNVKGIKFAILSYTSIINNWNLEKLYVDYSYLTNIIPNFNNKYYKEIYKKIEIDFQKAKDSKADYIIALVHMGTQFNLGIDNFQKKWNKIFTDLGADFILGDHAHSVEPLEILGKSFIANCPGNFVNSYIKYNGDATSIIDLYFSKSNKKFLGSSIVPMYTQEFKPKYFRAVPIFKIINNSINISFKERERVKKVHKLITKVMIRKEIPISEVKENYFFINGTYMDITNKKIKDSYLFKENYKKKLFKLINNSYSITFIGDSITEGTKNNFHPWYEPLIYHFQNKKIINISKGSYTTKLIIKDFKYHILKSKSDLYIIAIGTNDIRYRNPKICSMTKEIYINNIKKIIKLSKKHNSNSKFVLISPWLSMPNDKLCKLNEDKKKKLFEEYSTCLKLFCIKNNYTFINPNQYIYNKIKNKISKYLIDKIHPNELYGIQLYSKAVLFNSDDIIN